MTQKRMEEIIKSMEESPDMPYMCLNEMEALEAAELLRLAASCERGSEHPLGQAIVTAAVERELPLTEVEGFASVTGKGVLGRVEGREIKVGSAAWLELPRNEEADRLAAMGKTPMLVTVGGVLAGTIAVADVVKEDSRAAIQAMAHCQTTTQTAHL